MNQTDNKINQKVNLYQKQFHPEKEKLTLAHGLIAFLLVIASFAGISWMKIEKLKRIEQQISQQEKQHQTMLAQLSKLAAASNNNKKEAVKETDIETKEQELRSRRELLTSLTDGKHGSTEGFSDYLLALSRQHVNGTWITGLSVQNGGEKLAIAGSCLKPELAPVYLQKLSDEKIFTGKTFGVMELVRQETESDKKKQKSADQINFIFRTNNDDVTQVEEIGNGT